MVAPDAALEESWRRYHETGDPALRNRIVMHYVPLVKYVAGRMRSRLPDHVDSDDLVSEGMIGLVQAVTRYESGHGAAFPTFAVQRIRGAILDGLRGLDKVSRATRAKVTDLRTAQTVLEQRLGRTPTDEELAAELAIPVGELDALYSAVAFTSQTHLEGIDVVAGPASSAPQLVEDLAEQEILLDAVEELAERDQVVIALYYFEGLTLAEIGRVLGVSEVRVSQLHSRATMLLRNKLSGGPV